MSPERAREHISRAKKQLDTAAVHRLEAVESALVAAAEASGERWTKNHLKKEALAEKLVRVGSLRTDVSSRLRSLNDPRKDALYGEPGSGPNPLGLQSGYMNAGCPPDSFHRSLVSVHTANRR
jgi:hypothetical protein